MMHYLIYWLCSGYMGFLGISILHRIQYRNSVDFFWSNIICLIFGPIILFVFIFHAIDMAFTGSTYRYITEDGKPKMRRFGHDEEQS